MFKHRKILFSTILFSMGLYISLLTCMHKFELNQITRSAESDIINTPNRLKFS